MSKIYFITFGGPSQNYLDAVNRICNQAKELNIFDEIIGYTDSDLKADKDFWVTHGNFIERNERGYGFYIWKPYLILKTLEKMNDNDILLYLDCGCELNPNGKAHFYNLIEKVNNTIIISTSAGSNDISHTKMDLIKYFDFENKIDLLSKVHMQAGTVMFRKTDLIIKIYKEIYEIMSNNYNLLDNSPSINKNFDNFIEHRHDQSVFNLVMKKYDINNYWMDPTDWTDWSTGSKKNFLTTGINYPIWSNRNKSGTSIKDMYK
jgi:hypothetical protein